MMLAMYFVVALTLGQLTARLREEKAAEHRREENSRALYLFTRELADARDQTDIMQRVVAQVGATFDAEVSLLLPPGLEHGAPAAKGTWALQEEEKMQALHAIASNQPVALKNGAGPPGKGLFVPLAAGAGPIGAMAVRFKPGREAEDNRQDLLENFAKQTALVLDRQRLRDAETKARLIAESERFGRTLLSSVSHELRTPLAAIATAADTLRGSGELNPFQAKLSAEIDAAIFRLNRVVQSLLSAARIQSGQLRPKMDWCDLADVLRATLRELGPQLATHSLEQKIQDGLPLVRADFVLLVQAVSNLLVNAVTYSPNGSTIELTAELVGSEAVIRVADHGPGLASGQIERIFDMVHRAPGAKPGGTGLGLAIVKGFVEAQGGRVEAGNRPQGGALFRIWLPVREAPEISEEPL